MGIENDRRNDLLRAAIAGEPAPDDATDEERKDHARLAVEVQSIAISGKVPHIPSEWPGLTAEDIAEVNARRAAS